MRVSKDDVICGLPAPQARSLMRLYFNDYTAGVAAEVLGIDERAAERVLRDFEVAGYLARGSARPHCVSWTTTTHGNALAQASFGKPITRATADRHLAEVIERVRAFNADARRLLSVSELAVFGSYLDTDAQRLGDLDLAVTVVRRAEDGQRHVDRVLEYARASGRRFDTFHEELLWPRRELWMYLRNRSPAIKITGEEIRKLTDRFKIVYTLNDDAAAVPVPPDALAER
jgi:predicted nucleotidyltransferase